MVKSSLWVSKPRVISSRCMCLVGLSNFLKNQFSKLKKFCINIVKISETQCVFYTSSMLQLGQLVLRDSPGAQGWHAGPGGDCTRKTPAAHRWRLWHPTQAAWEGTDKENKKEAWKPASLIRAAPFLPCRCGCHVGNQANPAEEAALLLGAPLEYLD